MVPKQKAFPGTVGLGAGEVLKENWPGICLVPSVTQVRVWQKSTAQRDRQGELNDEISGFRLKLEVRKGRLQSLYWVPSERLRWERDHTPAEMPSVPGSGLGFSTGLKLTGFSLTS